MKSTLSYYKLYLLLRHNIKLSERRNPMFEQNQYAKIFGYIGAAVFCIYFMFIGGLLGWGAIGGNYGIIFIAMPFILLLDFFIRFGIQQTPCMLIKPYLLLPISKYVAIDCFLVTSILSTWNFIWQSLFLPYVYITCCGGTPIYTTIVLILVLQILIFINSQWYLFARTLINQHIYWWALPAALYGALVALFWIVWDADIDKFFDFVQQYALTPYSIFLYILIAAGLFYANRRLQMRFIYNEISRKEKTKLKHVSEFKVLNKFGYIGEYLKLEIKSTMRNKAIRTRFIQGVIIITILSCIIAYSDMYSGSFAKNIWCLYCFLFFGAVNLVKVMGPEGNYIDLLMVHEENILTLLRAKYYFYCAILLLPLIILIPTVFSGKFSLLMILAYLLTTTGPGYCLLFQLAVYNKQSLPLNEKITGKGQFENKLQLIIEAVIFFVPVFFAMFFTSVFGDTIGYSLLIIIGLLFTIAHNIWMRNIYKRMMQRRYANLDGFHTTR